MISVFTEFVHHLAANVPYIHRTVFKKLLTPQQNPCHQNIGNSIPFKSVVKHNFVTCIFQVETASDTNGTPKITATLKYLQLSPVSRVSAYTLYHRFSKTMEVTNKLKQYKFSKFFCLQKCS